MRSAILHATEELLVEAGFDALTIEAVAARAGVHKTTVYRRWPTKSELIADSAREASEENIPIPDSGSFSADLQALARAVAGNMTPEARGRRSRSLVAAAITSDELAAGMGGFWAERLALSGAIVERAIERGELPPGTDATLVIETLIGPLWVRLLLTGEPVTMELADEVAALVAAGAGAEATTHTAGVNDTASNPMP